MYFRLHPAAHGVADVLMTCPNQLFNSVGADYCVAPPNFPFYVTP